MNKLVSQVEKLRPHLEKISRNSYLRAIQEGFIASMPLILFSSLFLLITFVPNIFGFYWSSEMQDLLMKPYTYSMGIIALLVAGTTAKSLTDSFNRNMPKINQINNISTMLAAIVSFLFLSTNRIEGGFSGAYLGTTGLLAAFISAFITVNVYRFCIKNNLTITMPDSVPPNISQTFKSVIPFGMTVLIVYLLDFVLRLFADKPFAQIVIEMMQPLFTASDGYLGLAIIWGAVALFWFVGIHGPSIVEPAIISLMYFNIEQNLLAFQAGEQATNILTPGMTFLANMGGTGATFVVPFMFMLLAKSKQNKAVGKASFIPTMFCVNEPILFGGPLVLNPVFFIPFILAPILNVWLFKFFVDVFGMNSSVYVLPWVTPAPIGLILSSAFDKLSFVLAPLLMIMDVLIYYPFFKIYDNQILESERLKELNENNDSKDNKKVEEKEIDYNELKLSKVKRVLVLCAGGGTSGLLANALTKAAEEYQMPVEASADAYGAHHDRLKDFDLVILAPQVASQYEDIKTDTDKLGILLAKTEGAQYISLTRDPKGAFEFVMKQFKNVEEI